MLRRLLLLCAGLLVAWLAASYVLFVRPRDQTSSPARADAIVMLAGQRGRLPVAERLARQGVAPILLLSRGGPSWPAAARLCRDGRYAEARVRCFHAQPYSTRGEARTVAKLARANGWRSVVVVSTTYHLTRAGILFRRCWDGRLSFVGAPDPWWRQPYDWALETGKLLVQETVERSC